MAEGRSFNRQRLAPGALEMKLAAKLISIILGGIILLLVMDGYLQSKRMDDIYEEDMHGDIKLLGSVFREILLDHWRTRGPSRVKELITKLNQRTDQMEFRWVTLEHSEPNRQPTVPVGQLPLVQEGRDQLLKYRNPKSKVERIISYFPLDAKMPQAGILEISEGLEILRTHHEANLFRTFILTGILLSIGGIAIAFLGIRMVGRPLKLLINKTEQVGAGCLTDPLPVQGRDELAELARALNMMCDKLSLAHEQLQTEYQARIEAIEQLRHTDRLRTVGTLASGVAHELGTPLNVISGRAGMILREGLSREEISECSGIIRTQTERMTTIIRQLLDFARRRSPKKTRTSLAKVARNAMELMEPLIKKKNVQISLTEKTSDQLAVLDPVQFQQVLSNLLANAIQASSSGEKVVVTVGCEKARPPDDPKGQLRDFHFISIMDHGSGISEEVIRHLFDPFFTTKDVGEGTGLGLSIAHEIVHDHGGWILVTSEMGQGSTFKVYLPGELAACPDE